MIIEPKVRGFICTTSHPEGCYQQVKQQVNYVKAQPAIKNGPKNVLVIGASTGYGLASRITASFGAKAKTIGVSFEKAASGKRTASAGWYNTAAFEALAQEHGLFAASINGDAFSDEIKTQTIELIKKELGKVDLVIYSLASPRRTDPDSGESFSSALKTIDQVFTDKSIDPLKGEVTTASIGPATEQEINDTIKVMGGEDWERWMLALNEAGVLSSGVKTVAYSYVGPKLTFPIYRHGTIGQAKLHLENTAKTLTRTVLAPLQGQAFVSVNKAVVTQSSAAIPVVPLYISILFKVMKEKNIHEGCIEQISRLFLERLYTQGKVPVDEASLIRIDDWEMRDDIQQAVADAWEQINNDNLHELADLKGYLSNFFQLFGFETEGVDYAQESTIDKPIPSIED